MLLNLNCLIQLLLMLTLLGMGGLKMVKRTEAETAKVAVKAHKQGYLSIKDFHHRLTYGK